MIISSQICISKFQRFFTLGDGCWLPIIRADFWEGDAMKHFSVKERGFQWKGGRQFRESGVWQGCLQERQLREEVRAIYWTAGLWKLKSCCPHPLPKNRHLLKSGFICRVFTCPVPRPLLVAPSTGGVLYYLCFIKSGRESAKISAPVSCWEITSSYQCWLEGIFAIFFFDPPWSIWLPGDKQTHSYRWSPPPPKSCSGDLVLIYIYI